MLSHSRRKQISSQKKKQNTWPNFKVYGILVIIGRNGLKARVLIYQVSHSIVTLGFDNLISLFMLEKYLSTLESVKDQVIASVNPFEATDL